VTNVLDLIKENLKFANLCLFCMVIFLRQISYRLYKLNNILKESQMAATGRGDSASKSGQ
jgi:hypothetical protein